MIVLTNSEKSHLRLFSTESGSADLASQPDLAPEPSPPTKSPTTKIGSLNPQVETIDPVRAGHQMESLLRAAIELTDCQAAALYLLDDATSKLSLRHALNLPADALLAPPRRLSESIADLEALAGSAVVLEDDSLHSYWRVPQTQYGAAICVPVANAATILGTLWVFSKDARPLTAKDTQLVEIIAGRIAADLGYDALCSETLAGARLERQWAESAQRQKSLQPAPPALPGGWEVAGWTSQAEGIGGAMFDWQCDDRDQLKLVAGQAMECGLTAALGAASLRTGLRLLSTQMPNPADILAAVGKAIWSASAGDQFASALVGSLDPLTGDLRYSAAGRMHAVLVVQGRSRRLAFDAPPLGVDPDAAFTGGKTNIAPGATVVIFTEGASRRLRDGRRSAEVNVAQILRKFRHQSLTEQVAALGRAAEPERKPRHRHDAAMVAIRRPARG